MDEEKKISVKSEKSPFRALSKIDETLSSAYEAPGKIGFSEKEDEAIVEKAVLYHRIRQTAALREGTKSATNDIRYRQLSDAILVGRDPVANYIKAQKPDEQANLLEDLMRSDSRKAWFESMLTYSEEKKTEAGALKTGSSPDPVKAASCQAQSELFGRLADHRGGEPKEFLSKPENYAAVSRMLAIELHRQQVELEKEEFMQSIQYESPEDQEAWLKERPPLPFEKAAAEDMEAHLKSLESRPEVVFALHSMTQLKDIEELAETIRTPPKPQPLQQHNLMPQMEEKLVPDAIASFLEAPGGPEKDTSLYKMLTELSEKKKEPFPEKPTAELCEKRVKEYESVLEKLDKSEYAATESGKKLKNVLNGQKERLQDVAVAPDRERIKFNFRADTLIDYADINDETRKPINAMEAREKLIRGGTLEQKTFVDGEFAGTVQTVTYDKKTGLINKGPEKLITRVADLSDKTEKKPELQLEELRKIKEVLQQSDPFYVSKSESYSKVMDSLNKVIKAQESLDHEANIRQVGELRSLYMELDTNVGKYVKEKPERMKTGQERTQLRMDSIKTLQTLTGEKHVGNVTLKLFDEQKKLDNEQQIAKPCVKIMNKWKKAGTPTTPEGYAEFKKDFEALSARFDKVEQSFGNMPYFKMNVSEQLDSFTKQAEEVQKKLGPEDKLKRTDIQKMKRIGLEGEQAKKELYAMDPSPTAAKKPAKKTNEKPQKTIAAPKR